MFIKSKKQMQKLFDPSTEMTSSINEPEVNINNSNQSYEEAQIQTYIDALQYEEGTFVQNFDIIEDVYEENFNAEDGEYDR